MNIRTLLLVITGCYLASSVMAQVQPVDTLSIGNNASAGHYMNIRGCKFYYEEYGTGLPVVMLHNNGGSISNFMYQIPYFARSFKVIAIDSRAQGKSVDNGDSLSYQMMADDVNTLLDSLRLFQCFVMGWNDGAITGLLLAIHHPDKVRKLAITGARLSPDTSALDATAVTWALQYYRSIQRLAPSQDNRNRSKVVRLLTFGPDIKAAEVKKISCPVLVIGGDHDVVLPRHTTYIASLIPQSYLWLVPGAGNAIPVDFKDAFNNVVDDFFRRPYQPIEGLNRFN